MRSLARPLAALALIAAISGCSGSAAAPSSAQSTAGAERPTAAPSAAAKTPRPTAAASAGRPAAPASVPVASPVGTTQTPWGRILDAVPAGFPVFPDATVADPPPGGAVSGAWQSTAPVSEVATWYHDALLGANFAKVDLGSPLEDGSRVLDVQGDLPECKAQVTVKPLGGSTMITALFGAGCAGGSG